MFLTHAEFSLVMEGMAERYRAFTNFPVITGVRFGEATALTVADGLGVSGFFVTGNSRIRSGSTTTSSRVWG